LSNRSTALSAPGFGRGRRLLRASQLDAFINLVALRPRPGDDQILPVEADSYGGAMAHANM
jgi:hypothetical protein